MIYNFCFKSSTKSVIICLSHNFGVIYFAFQICYFLCGESPVVYCYVIDSRILCSSSNIIRPFVLKWTITKFAQGKWALRSMYLKTKRTMYMQLENRKTNNICSHFSSLYKTKFPNFNDNSICVLLRWRFGRKLSGNFVFTGSDFLICIFLHICTQLLNLLLGRNSTILFVRIYTFVNAINAWDWDFVYFFSFLYFIITTYHTKLHSTYNETWRNKNQK